MPETLRAKVSSKRLRYNLKNRERWAEYAETGDYITFLQKNQEWFEGFERKLRRKLQENQNITENTSSELWLEGARWNIVLLKELLGDE